jgi:Zn-dependent peptidase ImmA (M78 family)
VIPQARKTIPLAKARDLLLELRLEEPSEIDTEAIAFMKGANVQEEPLEGMDGYIVREGDSAIITVNSNLTYPGQKRFVIAHELGHFFLHPNARQFDAVDAAQATNWSEGQAVEEYEANLFAAELLMPYFMFAKRLIGVDPSLDFIEQLSADFQTTLTSTAVQFVLNTKEECFLVSSSNRRRAWFICSPSRSFTLLDDLVIHGHSCAAEVGPRKLKSRDSKIDAGFWLEGFKYNHKARITEDSRYFPTLNKTLTLLWIHDEI